MGRVDYMFVCDCGANRSLTAARVFGAMAKSRGRQVTTDYAGIGIIASINGERAFGEILRAADKVFVMDQKQQDQVTGNYRVSKERVVNLDIPDDYDVTGKRRRSDGTRYQTRADLEKVLRAKLQTYVDETC